MIVGPRRNGVQLHKNWHAADLVRAKLGGDYFPSWRGSRITPWCEPSTTATYAFATSAEARPEVGSMPNFTIVSFTQGGLTALTRKFRGISSAAARKTFKTSVDHRNGCAPRHGVHREDTCRSS